MASGPESLDNYDIGAVKPPIDARSDVRLEIESGVDYPRDARQMLHARANLHSTLSLSRSGKGKLSAFRRTVPRSPAYSFVAIIQALKTGSKSRAAITLLRGFDGTLNAMGPHWEGSRHETYDSSNRQWHWSTTRRRRMRPAHDARDDDNNAPVIDWSTSRYNVTRTAR